MASSPREWGEVLRFFPLWMFIVSGATTLSVSDAGKQRGGLASTMVLSETRGL
jgi:hypothetical protein